MYTQWRLQGGGGGLWGLKPPPSHPGKINLKIHFGLIQGGQQPGKSGIMRKYRV